MRVTFSAFSLARRHLAAHLATERPAPRQFVLLRASSGRQQKREEEAVRHGQSSSACHCATTERMARARAPAGAENSRRKASAGAYSGRSVVRSSMSVSGAVRVARGSWDDPSLRAARDRTSAASINPRQLAVRCSRECAKQRQIRGQHRATHLQRCSGRSHATVQPQARPQLPTTALQTTPVPSRQQRPLSLAAVARQAARRVAVAAPAAAAKLLLAARAIVTLRAQARRTAL